jgi:hypothetical protein
MVGDTIPHVTLNTISNLGRMAHDDFPWVESVGTNRPG